MDLKQQIVDVTMDFLVGYEERTYAAVKAGEFAEKIMALVPKAGTSAYQLIGAAAAAEVETTDTLMQMLAATILATLIEEEGTGRSNITYSPASMDHMMQNYDFTVEREAMATTIRIEMKPDSTLRDEATWRAPSNRHQVEDVSDAKPQAEPKTYDRPVWAIRVGETLYITPDRAAAEKEMDVSFANAPLAIIVNRECDHVHCPDTVCNQK